MKSANPSKNAIPQKSYFRIGEVASIVGVEPHVLRYWEREFRGVRPTKSEKGQRVYSRKDVEKLSRVRELLYEEGFTIAGAKKKLSGDGDAKDEMGVSPATPEAVASLAAPAPAATNHVALATAIATHAETLIAPRSTATQPGSTGTSVSHRQALLELRTEIVAFLELLEAE